jgi:PPOX class probable F420-dependent enzyme
MPLAMTGLGDFSGEKYLNLETFRQSGAGVRTPVWFAAAPGADGAMRLYVYSAADAGKVKRIRHTGAVRIAPCTASGTITGGWVEARAGFVTGNELDQGMRLLNRKYWPWKSLLDILARLRPGAKRVLIEIRVG